MSKLSPWVCYTPHALRALFVINLLIMTYSVDCRAQVSGTVFYDFDANGIRTLSSPTEAGVAAIGVRIFVNSNSLPFVTQTDTAGHYAFTAQDAPSGSVVRVEFFNLPETFSVSSAGPQNGTEVQFARAPASNINLGIFNDDEFCGVASEAKVVTACYTMGDPLKNGSAGDDPALVLFGYDADGEGGTPSGPPIEKLANASAIGSTWISAYQRSSNTLLMGAITRRHVGLGPLGTGGFYSVDLKSRVVSNFIDVKTIGIDTGPDPHIDPTTGLNILPADKLARSRDSLAFHVAAKVGMGGSQLSVYQDTLFLINLYDRKLYSFSVQKPLKAPANMAEAQTKSFQIPNPGCSNNEFAPWALKYYRGKLYVGVVCTAETSQKQSDLKAAIYEFDPKSTAFKSLLEFGLDYPRGAIDTTPGCDTINGWRPWTNVFPKQCNYPAGSADPVSAFAIYPQAILSDIEFDDDGSLLIGFTDRLGLQTGQNQPGIAVDDTLNYYGFMSGDLVRAQYNTDSTYTLENNGKSGSLQGCGINTNSGPGGGEFFCEDYWINGLNEIGHQEITNGAMLKIAGIPEVLVSAMDPIHGVYLSTGFIAYDTKTGKRNRSFSVYSLSPGSLGKSGGVGDLARICEPAPLEIGNKVWFDANKDGIQTPNEVPLDNIVITLHDMQNGGTEVARDTTANGGHYYFNDTNVAGGLKRKHTYEIRIDLNQEIPTSVLDTIPANDGLQLPTVKLIDTLTISPLRVTGDTPNILRDSDAEFNGDSTQIVVKVTTGDNSQNNYTFDIGMTIEEKIDLEITKRVVGNCLYEIGDEVTFEIVVRNAVMTSAAIADSVMIADTLINNLSFVNFSASKGTYNPSTHIWGPFSMQPGESDTLRIKAKINTINGFKGGFLSNQAEVIKAIGIDVDSEPNNSDKTEDDYAIAYVSVPIPICTSRKDTLIIKAPDGFTSFQWFKDGVEITGATSQTLSVHEPGSYTVKVDSGQCPTNNCCPIVVREYCECPNNTCVPIILKKIKASQSTSP
jgi:uncharacterized repeat protein (TIGR01451 family)